MRKLLFIIVLFFSTSVFSLNWEEATEELGLADFLSDSPRWVLVDTKIGSPASWNIAYTFYSKSQNAAAICIVEFKSATLSVPEKTKCYFEENK